jgi:hypothetical protein
VGPCLAVLPMMQAAAGKAHSAVMKMPRTQKRKCPAVTHGWALSHSHPAHQGPVREAEEVCCGTLGEIAEGHPPSKGVSVQIVRPTVNFDAQEVQALTAEHQDSRVADRIGSTMFPRQYADLKADSVTPA